MFHLNGLAFLMLLPAGMIGVGTSHLLFGGSERASGAIAGVVMLCVDVWCRNRSTLPAGTDSRWWSAHRGGFIAIMPSWLMGLVVMAMAATHPYWSAAHVR